MQVVRRLLTGAGYTWAFLCLVLVLATFIGLNFWDQTLVRATGIHVSPRFSGGEIRQTIEHGSYRTLLHRLVFDGLTGDRSEGFVQIDWVPQEGQVLPSAIEEEFDIDGDGTVDIRVRLDTSEGKAELSQRASWVLGLDPLITADSERILRVQLRKPQK